MPDRSTVQLKMVSHVGLVTVAPLWYDRRSFIALLVRHRERICNATLQNPEAILVIVSGWFLYSGECIQMGYECNVSDFVSYIEESGD